MTEVLREVCGDSWEMLACIDRMVELKEIVECNNPTSKAAQYRIFTNGEKL
jgi:hypothetical protein